MCEHWIQIDFTRSMLLWLTYAYGLYIYGWRNRNLLLYTFYILSLAPTVIDYMELTFITNYYIFYSLCNVVSINESSGILTTQYELIMYMYLSSNYGDTFHIKHLVFK